MVNINHNEKNEKKNTYNKVFPKNAFLPLDTAAVEFTTVE